MEIKHHDIVSSLFARSDINARVEILETLVMVILALDAEMREKFCKFLECHGYATHEETVRQSPLLQAAGLIEMFINAIGSEQIRLLP